MMLDGLSKKKGRRKILVKRSCLEA